MITSSSVIVTVLAATSCNSASRSGWKRSRLKLSPLELLGIDHAPDAVVLEDQPVAIHDLCARRGLGIGKAILDDLEDHVVRRQCEDGHDHAPWRRAISNLSFELSRWR